LTKTHHSLFNSFVIKAKYDGPHVLIIAGVHGDELEPMLAARNLINKLNRNLMNGKVTVLPVANGSAFNLASRCGRDGLDLARTFPGKKNGSLTQKTAYAISRLIQTADYLIDLHTGGALLDILPLTGYLLHSSEKVLTKQRQMAQAFNLPVIWGTDAEVEGRTLSVARDYNIPAIYAECRGGLAINKNTVDLYEDGCMNVISYLGLTASPPKRRKTFTWLEDYTPGQGHLQVKLPAPETGIFIPAVSLGQKVKKGRLLGHIIHPLQNTKIKITAPEEGLVFMLRIPANVRSGDSLGGILPVSSTGKKIIYAK